MVMKALRNKLFSSVHDEYLWDQHDYQLMNAVSLSKTTLNLIGSLCDADPHRCARFSFRFSFSQLQLCMEGTLRYCGTRGTRGYNCHGRDGVQRGRFIEYIHVRGSRGSLGSLGSLSEYS